VLYLSTALANAGFSAVFLRLHERSNLCHLAHQVLQVLQFSPAEMTRCRDALKQREESLASANAASELEEGVHVLPA